MMERLKLFNTDIEVSRLCMGGCPMGQYGWGIVQEQELIDAVHAAIDNGINFFDTADTYGLGTSERTLGKALGSERNKVVIATKFGVRAGNGKTFYDNSPQWIETALHNSLKRLGTDYIDLYQVHYRDATPIEVVVETLERFKNQGKIRAYGLSNIQKKDIGEFLPFAGSFASVQDEFSLACRKNENDLLELTEKLSLTPMTWGSLGQGILTGKYTQDSSFGADDRRSRKVYVNFHGEKLIKNLHIVDAMRPIARKHQVQLAAVAVRFILQQIKGSVVLVGAKCPSQIKGSLEAMDWRLSPDELQRLDEVSA